MLAALALRLDSPAGHHHCPHAMGQQSREADERGAQRRWTEGTDGAKPAEATSLLVTAPPGFPALPAPGVLRPSRSFLLKLEWAEPCDLISDFDLAFISSDHLNNSLAERGS